MSADDLTARPMLEFDKAMFALQFELSEEVWTDVNVRWHAVRDRLAVLEAENARLREWKDSAMSVLGDWEVAWETAGRPGKLGSSKAGAVVAEIQRLQATQRKPGQAVTADGVLCDIEWLGGVWDLVPVEAS